MTARTTEEKLRACAGCRNNFYNYPPGSDIAIGGCCTSLATATLVRKKKVAMSHAPPWKQEPIEVHDCFSQSGFVFVGPDREY